MNEELKEECCKEESTDDCCDKKPDESTNGLQYASDYQSEGILTSRDESTIRPHSSGGISLGGAVCLNEMPDEGPRPDGINYGNRIKEISINELDMGYVMQIGCQKAAIEDSERLIELLTLYINNPQRTETRWLAGQLKRNRKPDEVVIGVVAKSLDDFKMHIEHQVLTPKYVKRSMRTGKEFFAEFDDVVFRYVCLAKPDDCRSIMFDKIQETHRARENKKFPEIIEICNTALKR